jgi:CRISPR/Cas system CSM-associated protein Csm2 small subunit
VDGELEAFVETAYDPAITAAHRAAATNAICSILGYMRSTDQTAKLAESLWFKIFSVILDRSESAKGKSMRQLLTALTGLLPFYDPTLRRQIESRSLTLVLQTLLAQSDQGKVKAAFQVLAVFLSKKILTLERFVDYLREFDGQPSIALSDSVSRHLVLQEFTRKLFDWVQYQDSAPAASQAICALLQQVEDESSQQKVAHDSSKLLPFWIQPLIASLKNHPESLTGLRYYVFPSLFAMDAQGYVCFLDYIGIQRIFNGPTNVTESMKPETRFMTDLLYASLQVGKEVGIVLDACE